MIERNSHDDVDFKIDLSPTIKSQKSSIAVRLLVAGCVLALIVLFLQQIAIREMASKTASAVTRETASVEKVNTLTKERDEAVSKVDKLQAEVARLQNEVEKLRKRLTPARSGK